MARIPIKLAFQGKRKEPYTPGEIRKRTGLKKSAAERRIKRAIDDPSLEDKLFSKPQKRTIKKIYKITPHHNEEVIKTLEKFTRQCKKSLPFLEKHWPDKNYEKL